MSVYAHHPLYALGMLYLLAMVLRAVLSWFPVRPGSPVARINHWLYIVTEPVLAPFRRVIPPMGVFDISYIVAFLVVYLLTTYVLYLVKV
jgi:YggT family protein